MRDPSTKADLLRITECYDRMAEGKGPLRRVIVLEIAQQLARSVQGRPPGYRGGPCRFSAELSPVIAQCCDMWNESSIARSAIQSFGTQMGSRIPPGKQYRVRARECMEAADRLNDPGRRIILLELAQRWLMLADQIDAIEARLGQKPCGRDRRGHGESSRVGFARDRDLVMEQHKPK